MASDRWLSYEERMRKIAFEDVQPKHLGNLHERMQYVMDLLQRERKNVAEEFWQAVWDLRLEVAFYEPVEPPYAKRRIT